MRKVKSILLFLLGISLSACGTYVPNIQEIGDDAQGELLVKAIVGSIHCEIRNAVNTVINNDIKDSKQNGVRYAEFLDNWAAQIALTLQVEEKSTINPTALWTPPGSPHSIFTLGGGLNFSADATRKDILNYYYTVKELKALGPCPTNYVQEHPPGSLLIQNDLKLAQWLSAQVTLAAVGQIGVPRGPKTALKQNALSHEVKFELVTTGSINPAWKLIRFSFDQSGSLFATTRDRTHDLIITLGPVDPQNTDTLAPTAQGSFFTTLLGAVLSSSIRGGSSP
jgi:hypothetical protein